MNKKLFYVLSTHWDREWYQTFQDYRYRLVDLVDDVLDGIKSGELKGPFYSDGQACLLEDYLEVRPEKTEEVKSCLKSGRIMSGPWYVLPDEFLISGESLIRNISLGIETTEKLGGQSSRSGFLCDMFGHISQMPQIFKGFGIESAYLWRGVNVDSRNVLWEGADGTSIPTYVCGSDGYGDYAIFVRKAFKHYSKFSPDDFCQQLEKYLKQEVEKNCIDPILLFDGLDHQCWDRQAYKALYEYVAANNDYELEHVGLDDYMKEMQGQSSKITELISGELRQVADDYKKGAHLIFGVLSSRVDIKQENTFCQNLLCDWAEPFSAFANILVGKEYPSGFLNIAWKWLLKNHPHDSICGCSIDQVHEDMKFRFSQTRQIGERLKAESLKSIAISTDIEIKDTESKITLFNPLPKEIDQVVEFPIQIPKDWASFGEHFIFEKLPGFRIYNTNGDQINYQRISQELNKKNLVTFRTKVPDLYETIEVRLAAKLKLPALGYKTLIVKQAETNEPVRHPSAERLAHSGNCLENEFLKATVNANGSVNLLDKKNGQVYNNILTFEENADIGDGWFHGMSANDETIFSTAGNARISMVRNGPEMATMKITLTIGLPVEFCFDQMKRSENIKDFTIDTYLTLRASSDLLEAETRIDNNIKDHRLRVVLPTNTASNTYLTDSLFDVMERNISLCEDNYKNKELDTDTRPQQSWTAISDNSRGLAVISPGLYETAVSDELTKPIKLTLFRSTRRTVMTSGEPKGQLLKPLEFKYAIKPIQGDIDREGLFDNARLLADGIACQQLFKKDIDIATAINSIPSEQGLIEVDNTVITSLAICDNSIRLRMFNPKDQALTAEINILSKEIESKFKTYYKADLQGRKISDEMSIESGALNIQLGSKEIVTLLIL